MHGVGGSPVSADVEELETFPHTQEGGGGGRSTISTVSGRKEKQEHQRTKKINHGPGQPMDSGGAADQAT